MGAMTTETVFGMTRAEVRHLCRPPDGEDVDVPAGTMRASVLGFYAKIDAAIAQAERGGRTGRPLVKVLKQERRKIATGDFLR